MKLVRKEAEQYMGPAGLKPSTELDPALGSQTEAQKQESVH